MWTLNYYLKRQKEGGIWKEEEKSEEENDGGELK